MTESLKVIALISGGKDSFYSLLHCIQNGHKVVALGNLYPPTPPRKSHGRGVTDEEDGAEPDLNSFMYQTVGHTVIPLYEIALGIPLYRQQINGSAIQTGMSYSHPTVPVAESSSPETSQDQTEDETESLIPLLRKIMAQHPDANALSTGAILSTYQRTRVESVALRLGLTPLSYLWQYPSLPPGTQTSLLRDMQAVGLDARVVKVASGGLDESFLWENVASEEGIRKVERSMKRFGVDGDGGVLGEGGEFETLVVDGPGCLFKGRIEVREDDRRIVREGGGAAWLRILDARVVMKDSETVAEACRVPGVLEQRFKDVLDSLNDGSETVEIAESTSHLALSQTFSDLALADTELSDMSNLTRGRNNTLFWTASGRRGHPSHTRSDAATDVIFKIRHLLRQSSLDSRSIVSTTILLRSMQDFSSVNSIYGALFTAPNPPSRVTISCGSLLPKDISIIIHLKLTTSSASTSPRKELHVQSRSYWAPANIGPYSQATSITIPSTSETDSSIAVVSVAGQISLVPSTMRLPPPSRDFSPLEEFKLQALLSLQHLFRIGIAMSVSWFTGTVAYLPSSPNSSSGALSIRQSAKIAAQAWAKIHTCADSPNETDDDRSRDPWEEHHYARLMTLGRKTESRNLPNWEVVSYENQSENGLKIPSFWAAEVEELPQGAGIEWAALSGVAGGAVKLSCRTKNGSWMVEQCSFGNVIQSVVKVIYGSQCVVDQRAEEALEAVGLVSEVRAVASWVDVTVDGVDRSLKRERYGGIVPCRSLWDAEGTRLAAVLVFETLA